MVWQCRTKKKSRTGKGIKWMDQNLKELLSKFIYCNISVNWRMDVVLVGKICWYWTQTIAVFPCSPFILSFQLWLNILQFPQGNFPKASEQMLPYLKETSRIPPHLQAVADSANGCPGIEEEKVCPLRCFHTPVCCFALMQCQDPFWSRMMAGEGRQAKIIASPRG